MEKFVVKIGYTDKWKSYDLLKFESSDNMFIMQQKVNAFEFKTEFLEKLNTKKDKSRWEMTPQTVNAYFHPMNNEIVFPAAILQPPFYTKTFQGVQFPLSQKDPNMLMAVNFGAIGAVIAHEITHGYDDQGRKFDHEGNINDWWQKEDTELFSAKTDLMAKQAELWTFEDTGEENDKEEKDQKEEKGDDKTDGKKDSNIHRMNGQLTMGENLADLGGMSLACQALVKRLGAQENRKVYLEAFFRSWANVWKSKQTNAFTIQRLATDPHAPNSFRANLVKNVDFFYEVFDVKPGDAMYVAPEKRVQMW